MKMKSYSICKVVLLFFSFLLFSFDLEAQISVGIKGGSTKAWEYYGNDVDLPEDAEIDVEGYYLSILSYVKINKFLDVGVEPGFVQRGAACVPGWNPFVGDTEFRLNYIEVPLMVRGNIALAEDKFELFGKVGYGGSMVVKGTEVTTPLLDDEPVKKTKIDFKDEFSSLNKYDHGLYSGFGIGYNFGKNQLFLEGNYYYGLKDFDDNNTSKNRSLQFGVGFTREISW